MSKDTQKPPKKDLVGTQIKKIMESEAKNLDDKIAHLRTVHSLDKGRIESALSQLMKKK